MLGCKCEAGLSNTGTANCVTIQSVLSKFVMVPLEDSTGARNFVDLTATLDEAYFKAKVNEADPSKRWFPLPAFENVEQPKADTSFEEAPSGTKKFLRQGKRSFAGEIWAETPQLLGKIQDNRCVKFGVFSIDVNGNLTCSKEGTKLYPVPADNQSFDAKLMFATDTTVQKISVSFDWYRLFDESTLWLITPDEVGFDFNQLEGLLDVVCTEVSHSQTQLVFDANLDYGTALNPVQVLGLLQADMTLVNSATLVPVAISGFTAVKNRYTITFASQSVATLLTLKIAKEGYVGTYEFEV